jgi:hypothetical protein
MISWRHEIKWGLFYSPFYSLTQTTSKFPFRWWGVHSTLLGKHQLYRPSVPHSPEEAALDALESRDENSGSYADSTR